MTDGDFALRIDGLRVLPRLSDYLDRYGEDRPSDIAVVCGERRIDYGTLRADVDALSRAMLAAGIGRGDRVAMLSTPRAEFWIAFLATVRIGATWVGLNPRYSDRERAYVLDDAAPALLLSLADIDGESTAGWLNRLATDRPALKVVVFGGRVNGVASWDDFLACGKDIGDAELQRCVAAVETRDPALIVYTSGSTGAPKGAVLTHYGLAFGANLQTVHFQVEKPSLVVCFPVNHVASVADTCATTFVRGGKIVFLERFDAAETLRATARERCTMLAGVPTMYQLQFESDAATSADLSSVELMLWGGAAMPADLIRKLQETGCRLMTAYGMTETATHVTYTPNGASFEQLEKTVGRPDPRCALRIATGDGAPSSASNTGEVQLKADFLMQGYWRREDATRAAHTKDGWFRTGDVGYLDTDGNLRLVGRVSDMFKSGGYNVYPREIETVLESHPAVAIAAVVGVADPLYQEVGCAWLQLEPGTRLETEELEAWCRDRLANYKVPKQFRVVQSLPLLPVGKVDKPALRKRALQD